MNIVGKIISIAIVFVLFIDQKAHADRDTNDIDIVKIQKSLQNMGCYSGLVDGNIETFESRKAIKLMNEKVGNGKSPFLTKETRAILIELSAPYEIDNLLSSDNNNSSLKAKNIKIQTSLKILGFSNSISDGIMGSRTWARVVNYKKANGLNSKPSLTPQERIDLVNRAIEQNSDTIDKLKEGLKIKI